MGPAGTVDGTIGRFLLPIGGGSVEATWTLHFHITATGRPYSGLGLPTTKHSNSRPPFNYLILFNIYQGGFVKLKRLNLTIIDSYPEFDRE